MAKNHAASAHADDHAPNVKLSIAIFAALLVLTLLTVAVSKLHLERREAISLGLAIALTKASLVAAVFMHLWGENKLIHRALYVVALFGGMLIMPILDGRSLLGRLLQRAPVASQLPAAEAPAK
jgi:caa(3)-type oxidase subunit IV